MTGVDKGECDGSAVGEAGATLSVRRPGCTAQAKADRERRLGSLAAAVLTALADRDALLREAERRAGQALRTMWPNR
jgi:hypothetical protein